jgi:DNA-binding transcriptional regulator YhcF (GntR family)
MISASTRRKLLDALIEGLSNPAVATAVGIHPNTVREYRRVFQRLEQLPVINLRQDRRGRFYRAENLGAHVAESRCPQTNVRRLVAIRGRV